jgi:AcrR family transcriptional regulator
MSRQRTIPDSTVLDAAFRVMSRLGPARFTLADVACEAGIAPATLIQRFGSKRGLQLEIARLAAEGADGCFARARAVATSPLAALLACCESFADLAASPDVLANNLGFLQQDLADAEFRRWTAVSFRATLAGFRDLIDEAVEARELLPCDSAGLARLVQATIHGSLVAWGFHQEGAAREALRRDLQLLLSPYVTGGKRTRKARPIENRSRPRSGG